MGEVGVTGRWEPVIGLEIHVQLATRTKLFCGDLAAFGGEPNTRVCPVCLGHPGALPVLNAAAVELGMRAALALGCTVHGESRFARKHYFYPDLPKGYQITQFARPLATGGGLAVPDPATGESVRIGIRRVHLEEDSGKSLHDRVPGRTAVDLNRAGVPLVEIVTEPDLRGPEHARAFLTALKRRLEYAAVSDCDMEKGSLRVDANVSVRRPGGAPSMAKTEVKNLNSFSQVEAALRFEAERQAEVLRGGGEVPQETLLWDAARSEARPMRSKESAPDYRYFPEPDLPPLVVSEEDIRGTRGALPEPPDAREARFVREYGVPGYDAAVLTASRDVADYYEALAAASDDPKAASNWVMTDLLGWLNEHGGGVGDLAVAPSELAALMALVEDGTLSRGAGRTVFRRMAETGEAAEAIVAREGLRQVRDETRLRQWVADALAAHPEEADRMRRGESRLVGYFVGRVMRSSGGAADPRRTRELILEAVGGDPVA